MENDMHEIALQLHQVSELLYQQVIAKDWGAVENIQRDRAQLIAQLEGCNEATLSREEQVAVKQLLHRAQDLEQQVLGLITTEQQKLGHEHNQLQRNKKASKAYGNFS